MFCSLCLGLTLLLLGSDVCSENVLTKTLEAVFPNVDMSIAKCGISTGANCAIADTVLWFVAGVTSCHAMKVEYEPEKDEAGLTEPLNP
jgi:hypothetical protein